MRRLDLKKAQAARLNTIRDINRQIVLNYVREREPISRAEIARETDLQRSTISVIVDGLEMDGLIEEIGEGESTGAREMSSAAESDRAGTIDYRSERLWPKPVPAACLTVVIEQVYPGGEAAPPKSFGTTAISAMP